MRRFAGDRTVAVLCEPNVLQRFLSLVESCDDVTLAPDQINSKLSSSVRQSNTQHDDPPPPPFKAYRESSAPQIIMEIQDRLTHGNGNTAVRSY